MAVTKTVTPTEVLYAQQAPEKLVGVKDLTLNDVFYIKQDPYSVANKLSKDVKTITDCEAGSYELASAMNSAQASNG